LIQQAAGGDRAALSELLLRHYEGLSQYISSRISQDLRGLVRPEDVLQQTFVRVAQGISSFETRHEGAFRGWLKTIAGNLLKDAEKRRRRERRAPAQHAGQHLSSGEPGDAALLVERLPRDSTAPSGRVVRRDNIRCMQEAMADLPTDQREVIRRHYLQGQSITQIAESMQRTPDAVRGLCYRARQNLRVLMGQSSQYFSG
jgi:RNA polymerase sigma-70 factor (ECF subfamily)